MKEFIKNNLWISATIISIIAGYALGFLSIYGLGEYGWVVFVVVPFFLGLIPTLVYGNFVEISYRQSTKLGFSTLSIFCATTLVFAIEGVICIIMASPIMALSTWIGSAVASGYLENNSVNSKKTYSFLIVPVAFLIVDLSTSSEEYLQVNTSITIDAPIETVWDNIISFGAIDEPDEWLFQTGIAYPTHAEIKGSGVGAVRYCNFTTGSFVEPITTWNEPTLLQFDVLDQPTPMRELNPFWDVHPPHLDGYFQSKKGQFELKQLNNGQTLVEGTTWYHIHIHPVPYWDFWSKYILHEIHYRVLKHIKKESEA